VAKNALDLGDRHATDLRDLGDVMPYFTHVRMQPNCERGISLGGGAG
jgi:hypothetical protein